MDAPEATNVANFIGITSEPITSGNSGKYNPQGGVATTTAASSKREHLQYLQGQIGCNIRTSCTSDSG